MTKGQVDAAIAKQLKAERDKGKQQEKEAKAKDDNEAYLMSIIGKAIDAKIAATTASPDDPQHKAPGIPSKLKSILRRGGQK